jgi:hypothetical protein
MRKETIVYFKIQFHHLPGGTGDLGRGYVQDVGSVMNKTGGGDNKNDN